MYVFNSLVGLMIWFAEWHQGQLLRIVSLVIPTGMECSTHRREIWFVPSKFIHPIRYLICDDVGKYGCGLEWKKKPERKRPSNRLHQSMSNVVYVALNNLNRIGDETDTFRPMWKILQWNLFSLCSRLLSSLMWLTLIHCKLHIDILTSSRKIFRWIVIELRTSFSIHIYAEFIDCY